jgi:hypothetical protein
MANNNAIEKEVQAFVVYGEPASKANSQASCFLRWKASCHQVQQGFELL